MEEKTKNMSGNNKAIIIVLGLIIVSLLGFIVYDKCIRKDSKPVPEINVQGKECNCQKCEECESNKLNIIEGTNSFKEIDITGTNQLFIVGKKAVTLRKDDSDHLLVNDNIAKNVSDGSEVGVIKAYLTENYIFFTDIGTIGESIVYAINESGEKVAVNNNQYQLNNIKFVDGKLRATGYIYCGIDCNAKGVDVIIKYANNTLTVSPNK